MGQKVSPHGLRVGVIKKWDSMWIASKTDRINFLHEDIKIRSYLKKTLGRRAMISKITINRKNKTEVEVLIHTAKAGYIMGEGGTNIKKLVKECSRIIKRARKVIINLESIENANGDARLLAEWIAEQLENRASFRTTQKKAIQQAMKAGVKGIKTMVSGRLAGADMARSEGYSEGIVPLHTIRSDVEYALAEAHTTYGLLGVKVWVCKGEVLEGMK